MKKELEVKAVYHDDLVARAQLYVICLLELARQLQAEEAVDVQAPDDPEGGEEPPGGEDDR